MNFFKVKTRSKTRRKLSFLRCSSNSTIFTVNFTWKRTKKTVKVYNVILTLRTLANCLNKRLIKSVEILDYTGGAYFLYVGRKFVRAMHYKT